MAVPRVSAVTPRCSVVLDTLDVPLLVCVISADRPAADTHDGRAAAGDGFDFDDDLRFAAADAFLEAGAGLDGDGSRLAGERALFCEGGAGLGLCRERAARGGGEKLRPERCGGHFSAAFVGNGLCVGEAGAGSARGVGVDAAFAVGSGDQLRSGGEWRWYGDTPAALSTDAAGEREGVTARGGDGERAGGGEGVGAGGGEGVAAGGEGVGAGGGEGVRAGGGEGDGAGSWGMGDEMRGGEGVTGSEGIMGGDDVVEGDGVNVGREVGRRVGDEGGSDNMGGGEKDLVGAGGEGRRWGGEGRTGDAAGKSGDAGALLAVSDDTDISFEGLINLHNR